MFGCFFNLEHEVWVLQKKGPNQFFTVNEIVFPPISASIFALVLVKCNNMASPFALVLVTVQ